MSSCTDLVNRQEIQLTPEVFRAKEVISQTHIVLLRTQLGPAAIKQGPQVPLKRPETTALSQEHRQTGLATSFLASLRQELTIQRRILEVLQAKAAI